MPTTEELLPWVRDNSEGNGLYWIKKGNELIFTKDNENTLTDEQIISVINTSVIRPNHRRRSLRQSLSQFPRPDLTRLPTTPYNSGVSFPIDRRKLKQEAV